LAKLDEDDGIEVVILDIRMPVMDGIHFRAASRTNQRPQQAAQQRHRAFQKVQIYS